MSARTDTENTSVNVARGPWHHGLRGQYATHPFHKTRMRIVAATEDTLTYRYVWGWRWVECVVAWYEDRVRWPITDLFTKASP